MRHRQSRTAEIRAQRTADGQSIKIDKYDDIYHGQAYLDAVEKGHEDESFLVSVEGMSGVYTNQCKGIISHSMRP
jgi:hypothetical protein